MAINSICATLKLGQDFSCTSDVITKYAQQAVIINKSDISKVTKEKDNSGQECRYRLNLKLKDGKEGIIFLLSEGGSSISGAYTSVRNDMGYVKYNHTVNLASVVTTEKSKCILDTLAKGLFVVALQLGDKIEIYGIENGLHLSEYTADPQANDGFVTLTLVSGENFKENDLPYFYVSDPEGQEVEDFDALFLAGTSNKPAPKPA